MVIGSNILAGASGQGGVHIIDQSIRFNDDDSAYLNRTPSSAGDRRTFTFSCWVKRANLTGANQPIFSAGADDWLMFLSAETLGFNTSGSNYRIVTTQLFRDPGAWMHIVLRVDTTNSTAGDRLRLYLNGSEITDFGTDSNPTLNFETSFNNTGEHDIGKLVGAGQYLDGYLAEINHVDGSSLAPSGFGETKDDGVWIPKKYSGAYGTNGFYITGATASDLGEDFSGNNNDFTSSGLTAADQVTDSPTNNTATFNAISATVNPATLSNGNLTALRSGNGSGIERSTISFPATENFYAEFTIDATGSGSHVWEVGIIADDDPGLSQTSESRLGNEENGFSYRTNWSGSPAPSKVNNGTATSYGSAGSAGHVIGVQLNGGSLTFYHNNVSQGVAFTGLSGNFLFAFSSQGGGQITANFGQTGFTYTPPTGAKALNVSNLSDPAIADPSQYFQSTLYTGNGSTQSISQSGNLSTFQPDWVWIKNRSAADSHVLTDAVRGATKIISSDATSAESTDADTLTAFESDGFALGDDDKVNTSSENYVAWQWKANGSGSSNTDGTINTTSTSVNTTAGFSICTYTGTGSNATVGHGLGVAPDVILVKERTSGSVTNWEGFFSAIGPTKTLSLNKSDAAQTSSTRWQDTSPTSSVFSIGTASAVNVSSGQFVAYCFAEVEGYSKFSSYTGNGSADGPFVDCGFSPAFVLTKNATNAGDSWPIADNVRSPFNVANATVFANLTTAETTGYQIDLLSNGFKARTTDHAVNESGATIIYMAFAETPFKTATAR